jgi:hypothetical protein
LSDAELSFVVDSLQMRETELESEEFEGRQNLEVVQSMQSAHDLSTGKSATDTRRNLQGAPFLNPLVNTTLSFLVKKL